MPEARAIRSNGWRIALLGLACCAAEADVLETGDIVPSGALDAGVSGGAADAGAVWDAVYGDTSDGSWEGEPVRFDAGIRPTWTSCDTTSLFERARTGDSCQFYGCRNQFSDCALRVAMCVEGVLHLAEVSKTTCIPDDGSNARRCYAVEEEECCVNLWQCAGTENVYGGEPVMRVCATCESNRSVTETQAPVTGCANDPDTPPWPRGWPPPLGMPCDRSFVCDSFGNSAGPSSAFRLDQYGLIYWCQGGIVQRAPIGNFWPWNEGMSP